MIAARCSPKETAKAAGLLYVSDEEPGIERRTNGSGFTYWFPSGRAVRGKRQKERIAALAIPPAWTEVWICREPTGHLQATGYDDRGRKQFLYHPILVETSSSQAFDRHDEFGDALIRIRRKADSHLRSRRSQRDRLLALVVRLLDLTGMRIGGEEYLAENGSHDLTTLRRRHVRFEGNTAVIRYSGKGGKPQRLRIDDTSALRVLRTAVEAGSDGLFLHETDEGPRPVRAREVNDYLREDSAGDVTTKDFRTWLASAWEAAELFEEREEGDSGRRGRNITGVVKRIAQRSANTPKVCRSSYVDPRLLLAYEAGEFLNFFSTLQRRTQKWLRCEDRILRHALARF